MAEVRFIWSDEYVGGRVGLPLAREGDRTKPYDERFWSPLDGLSLEELKDIQLIRLKHLLHYAWENSPFYRRQWQERSLRPNQVETLEDFQRFPVFESKDFLKDQAENPPFGSAFTRAPNRQAKFWQTSGSTGKPKRWMDTKEDLENEIFRFCRFLHLNHITPGWRGFFAFPFPPFNGFWLLFAATEAMGCQNVPKGSLGTQVWLELLHDLAGTAPSFLATTPTFAIRQQEVAKELGLDLRELKIDKLLLAGEPGATVPATKRIIEGAWGAKAVDFFGSTENGIMGFTCAAQVDSPTPADHLFYDAHIFELLDPESKTPVSAGQAGALCVTSLTKFGVPTIRYYLGDLLYIKEEVSCPCGSKLPLVTGGVQARADDMITIKGENIYPSLIEECVRSCEGLATEYRIQKTYTDAKILVESATALTAENKESLAKQLNALVKARTYVNIDIEILEPNTLPREMSKTKRVVK